MAFLSLVTLATAAACQTQTTGEPAGTESDVSSTLPSDGGTSGDRGSGGGYDGSKGQSAGDSAGSGGSGAGSADATTPPGEAPTTDPPSEPPPGDGSPERALAARLGLPARFSIGTGNDADGNDAKRALGYGLGSKIDIHYMYLSGLDWPSWNSPRGQYVLMHARAAQSQGAVPMFTLYQAAAGGEGALGNFSDASFMSRYWDGVRTMFERLGEFDAPAIVHLEPDFWGYAQQRSDDPDSVPVKVGTVASECWGLPENVAGMAQCAIKLARTLSPKVAVALSASTFGAYTDGASDPERVGRYLKLLSNGQADLTVVETLDRDAGCFEVGKDPNCQRSGSFYWDENNVKHPNFHDHLAWAKAVREATGTPLLWWQMPLGVPSNASGSAGHYRDNRVRYLFSHASEFTDAGGIGAVFGVGAGNQTTLKTDGGQFKNALAKYLESPAPLR